MPTTYCYIILVIATLQPVSGCYVEQKVCEQHTKHGQFCFDKEDLPEARERIKTSKWSRL